MSPHRLAITSCPDRATAERLGRALVEEKLAACVSLLPGARSIYRWQGTIEETDEVVCLVKTEADRVAALQSRLAALHPYEVPELLVFDVADGLPTYLAWLHDSTR